MVREETKQGPDGRFVKGHKGPGRIKGEPNRVVRAAVATAPLAGVAIKRTADVVRITLEGGMQDVIDNLNAEALKDGKLGLEVVKFMTPPPARLVTLPPEMIHAAPEDRVARLVAHASEGKMDLAQCETLCKLAEREYNAGIVRMFREVLVNVARANRIGDTATANLLLEQLAERTLEMSSNVFDADA